MNTLAPVKRRFPIGAEVSPGGVSFRVWANKRKQVDVVYDNDRRFSLDAESNGYFSGFDAQAKAGMRYRLLLDGSDGPFPDPASRFQPEGVMKSSQIINPSKFRWTDQRWQGIRPVGQVLYEMHIGTFTQEGTWISAIEKLSFLRDIGITCIELMPVADFAGQWNWGYDGVDQFAPARVYGTPDDMRRFVDSAHATGLGVILDVVYNHFGPSGNFIGQYSDDYFTDKHKNDWGSSLNFDGKHCAAVREFFITNARYWIEEFHLDGFRFDATQAILDDSEEHILAAITREARAAAKQKSIYIVAENEPQHTRIVRPLDKGGFDFDALWNDDFHHSAIVAITGRNEAYYTDHAGHPQEFISALKYGYLFQGQIYRWQKNRRGTPGLDLSSSNFVSYIQNHDQIANYGDGRRLQNLTSPGLLRAITAVMFLGPQTPMLFQGQEFGCSCPFNYFADHDDNLNKLICDGRRREILQFPSFTDERVHATIPNPCDRRTFENCKLNWDEIGLPGNQCVLHLHRDLMQLRRELWPFNRALQRGDIDGAILDDHVFCLRYFGTESDDLLLVVNLWNDVILHSIPEPLIAPPSQSRWATRWSSENPKYGGLGVTPLETTGEKWRLGGENWRIPGYSATLLAPARLGETT